MSKGKDPQDQFLQEEEAPIGADQQDLPGDKSPVEEKGKGKKEKKPKKEKKAKKGQSGPAAATPRKNLPQKPAINTAIIKRSAIMKPFVSLVARIITAKRGLTVEKVRMEHLRPPYVLLCTRQSFADYLVVERACAPAEVSHVVEAWEFANGEALLNSLGCIAIRRFAPDTQMLYHIKETILQKKVVALYPEAHASFAGTNSPLPDTLALLLKSARVPVVVMRVRGNYVTHSSWSSTVNSVKIEAVMTQAISADELDVLEPNEIMSRIQGFFQYDEYWWLMQNNYSLTAKNRAEGLHHVLYHCPFCHSEKDMVSSGDNLFCQQCGQTWEYTEAGTLSIVEGSLRQEVIDALDAEVEAAAQKAFDAQRLGEAQREYIQACRTVEFAKRKREEAIAQREEMINDAKQRLEPIPEFPPLPEIPPEPTPVSELPFVRVDMPPKEEIPELSRVPDWYEYQRKKVRQEVEQGRYGVNMPVFIEVLRDLKRDFVALGEGYLHHDASGMSLIFKDFDGITKKIVRSPLQMYSLHVDFSYRDKGPFIDLSTADTTYYLYPRSTDCQVVKMCLATEEMYKIAVSLKAKK